MELKEFAEHCRNDPRLWPFYKRLQSAALEVISDELVRVFRNIVPAEIADHRREFYLAQNQLVIRCTSLELKAPDLSIAKFINLLLQYE